MTIRWMTMCVIGEWVTMTTALAQAAAVPTPGELRTMCRQHYEKFEARADDMVCRYHRQSGEKTFGVGSVEHLEITVSQRGREMCAAVEGISRERPNEPLKMLESISVYAFNDAYAFDINRKKIRTDWLLRDTQVWTAPQVNRIYDVCNMHCNAALKSHFLHSVPLRELCDAPEYNITKTESITDAAGRPLIRAHFRWNAPQSTNPRHRMVFPKPCFGTFDVDPQRQYAVAASHWTNENIPDTEWIVEAEFVDGPGGLPVVSRVNKRTTYKGNDQGREFLTNFRYSFGTAEPKAARLSHYNLPEPVNLELPPVPPPRRGYQGYLIAAIAACGTIGLGFAWLHRRSKARTTAPETL